MKILQPTSVTRKDRTSAALPRSERAVELDPQLELMARWMDSVFEIPGLGIRFGLDAIIGLIPGFGDAVTSLISLYILRAASRYGVPRVTLVRMALNIAIDYVLGSIPVVGDAFDVYWKANLMNVALLRRHVAMTSAATRRASVSDWLFVGSLMLGLLAVLVTTIVLVYLLVAWIGHLLFRPYG